MKQEGNGKMRLIHIEETERHIIARQNTGILRGGARLINLRTWAEENGIAHWPCYGTTLDAYLEDGITDLTP